MIEVRATREGEGEQCCCACPIKATHEIRLGTTLAPHVSGGKPGAVTGDIVIAQHPGGWCIHLGVLFHRGINRCLHCIGIPAGGEVAEVEGGVKLIGPLIKRQALGLGHPGFPTEHPGWIVGIGHLAPLAVNHVHTILIPEGCFRRSADCLGGLDRGVIRIGQPGFLDQAVGHIDAEAIHATVKPEAQDVAKLFTHLRVRPVEIWLRGVKEVEVPVTGGIAVLIAYVRPTTAMENAAPVVGRLFLVSSLALANHVAVPGGGSRLTA